MKEVRLNIRNTLKEELELFFLKYDIPKFKVSQVWDWVWKHHKSNFDSMTNLSLKERELLKKHFYIKQTQVLKQSTSQDGTVKFLFQLEENKVVEGVLIPQLNRRTACISSQAGCSLACDFCATGKLKLFRNLTAGEIYDQVFLINEFSLHQFKKPITNIVFMGMGEPLLNIKNVLKAIYYITNKSGLGMSGKRITVSTVGITKIIRYIADRNPNFNLAISLHAATDKKRSQIMDINNSNNLLKLKESLKYFYSQTGIKPTFEYILLKGFNDTVQDANDLINFCASVPSKVNLIEYNKVEDTPYEKSTLKSTNLFINILEKKKVLVKLRKSRGEDIGAACGQLATQNQA
ncbi:MAG: 23S rRNA (adenine(2503)-C(2))-methyltransferase RlmN [Flavobacteriales bacterium]|nr:23S rRNA (adenine(2503)-C(2))-methyltransferase RlmN [Flavobacteriales bacterium]|tara:strand:- start:25388 stop:26434 length:1047 start_codon:yes stop_codon:yes gene_type:complete